MKTMPDAPSKTRWMKENLVIITIKLQKRYDSDVIAYLDGKNKRNVFLEAVREYMKNHPESEGKNGL